MKSIYYKDCAEFYNPNVELLKHAVKQTRSKLYHISELGWFVEYDKRSKFQEAMGVTE